ncbi:MAG: hypothetical protein U0R69_17045 [Gaiellales bacterium]
MRPFQSDELPAAVAHSTIRRLESDAPSAAWSLGNRLLMLMAGSVDGRGIRQWNAAGRRVVKGARAFYILAPRTVKRTEVVDGAEVERVVTVGFLGVPVFRVEDTEGDPIEQPSYAPAQLPPLFEVAERLGVTVRWLPFADRCYGYYTPGRHEIVLCSTDASVFFHELAHRAHEVVKGSLKGGQDRDQEIVAETVAAVLARMYDFDLGEIAQSRRYVERYANGKDAGRAVVRMLSEVEATLSVILTAAETPTLAEAA